MTQKLPEPWPFRIAWDGCYDTIKAEIEKQAREMRESTRDCENYLGPMETRAAEMASALIYDSFEALNAARIGPERARFLEKFIAALLVEARDKK